jgi:hypothetical protein
MRCRKAYESVRESAKQKLTPIASAVSIVHNLLYTFLSAPNECNTYKLVKEALEPNQFLTNLLVHM